MTVFAAIAFAALFLEHDDLVTLHEGLCDLANNFCTYDSGSTYCYGSVIVDEEDTVKLNLVALLALFAQIVDIEEASGLSFELLALNFYDNVH